MALAEVSLIFAGLYVGWSIGANDAANAMGPSVGSGLISYKRALFLFSLFALLGGFLQGGKVLTTVGKGIVGGAGQADLFIVMLVSAVFVTLASKYGLTVSTSQAIVGALVGVGLATGDSVEWPLLVKIIETWVFLPIGVAALTSLVYMLARRQMSKVKNLYDAERRLKALLLIGSCYISYSIGANHAGIAMGPVLGSGVSLGLGALGFLGGFAIAVGALTYGKNVTATVGRGITPLDPIAAFSVQLSASLGVYFFTLVGLPVSTSHSVIGAVLGIGLTRGMRTVSKRKLAHILIGWVATPTTTLLAVYLLHNILV